MYPLPIGPLPVTGVNMLAFAITAGALMTAGLVLLRLAYLARRRGGGPGGGAG
ncbi:MAG TPA: hypothetical protein VH478_18070 [Trebonia sp.]|jgi:hypothetical protein|nr:hypothetical protein [Trebonia sp.]